MEAAHRASGGAVLLLFGPQALAVHDTTYTYLRNAIIADPENAWMRQVIAGLPKLAESICERFPKLGPQLSPELLQRLPDWLEFGTRLPAHEQTSNVLLTPLVVLHQLAEYSRYVQTANVDAGFGSDRWTAQLRHTESLGFCTGLLSAFAVSSASNKAELEQYGASAIRLALLIGAVVDGEDERGPNGNSRSFSIAWSTTEHRHRLDSILEGLPEAYISVFYDHNRATVTTSRRTSTDLQRQTRDSGLLATEIGLRGWFHAGCHEGDIDSLISLCDEMPELQLPNASKLRLPTYSTTTCEKIQDGMLHHIALREILLEPCQWQRAFAAATSSCLKDDHSLIVSLGLEKCVPPTHSRAVGDRVAHVASWEEAAPRLASLSKPEDQYSDDDIAVIGMASKVAGADDLDELWDLMCRAESQHVEVPPERFTFDTHWRTLDTKRKWFGNFLKDHDTFDHKFFKKSPREVASQDPQQRLLLQSAYQAVEQSGYFNAGERDTRVGVFVGVCAADYEANVACYPPNAFTATGNLKSFIAGKISHYFGWTGPGLTIDTACSASAVAVHQACRAILGGECTAALAGGTNVMTSPLWFQNLAGASFLSPTGACKPFDSGADGYCRGEAVASVFLKRMSHAVHDGNPIIGCIRSTAVYQNENCTPIFVPNSPSLSALFTDVLQRARLRPRDISLVEAHGTGTPVGDPAEYESIKRVFGGSAQRSTPVALGSIKGLIGHTECVSGVMALIKVLILLQKGAIPPQASFRELNPAIKTRPDDMLEVVTQMTPWKASHRAALINNYGASGSNASMVVAQPPTGDDTASPIREDGLRHAFWIPAFDERARQAYCLRLRELISKTPGISLADLSYNLARQSNRSLPLTMIFACRSVGELDQVLANASSGKVNDIMSPLKPSRPVILCFGGQVSRMVGLDKRIYHSVVLLRKHLDHCNETLASLGLGTIYPTIFDKAPIDDQVKLQVMLFALQYSSAKCWMDCGVRPAAVVGHSFGELTAQCVAGRLSLRDSLQVVAARAELIRENWGPEPGSMIAIEGDVAEVQALLNKATVECSSEQPPTIACFNGPRSFTIGGSSKAVDAVERCVIIMPGLRAKRLSVSNAFHSALVEPIEGQLGTLSKGMQFHQPSLRWERATENQQSPEITPMFFGEHMRQPVYANHAFQRLHKDFPSAVWLEAGSNSTITTMAGKALGSPANSYFQAVNLGSDSALSTLTDVFVNLWKQGLPISHWTHHPLQAATYSLLLLPPYQFERSRHWLDLKKPQELTEQHTSQQAQHEPPLPTTLYTFVGYQDEAKRQARFRINTMIKQYEELVQGHVIAHTAPICPATVEVDLAIEALLSLRPDFEPAGLQPEIHDVENQAPLCIDSSRAVWLDLQASGADFHTWGWQITSSDPTGGVITVHVKGRIVFRSTKDASLSSEFARYARLTGHQRCLDILSCSDPDDTIQGRNMYRIFAEIVEYGPAYCGLQKLVGKGNISVGRVVKRYSNNTWLDSHLSDCFSQVGGFWVNCMTDRLQTDMYIAAGFESWIRAPHSPGSANSRKDISSWNVLASHQKTSEKTYTTDIFIFDEVTGSLQEIILGINYMRIPKSTMTKMLLRLTSTAKLDAGAREAAPSNAVAITMPPDTMMSGPKGSDQSATRESTPSSTLPEPSMGGADETATQGPEIFGAVAEILVELSGLELDAMKAATKLADIGIDSLMGMEMAHELESSFKCTLDTQRLAEVVTVQDVIDCVARALGVESSNSGDESSETQDDLSTQPSSIGTPTHSAENSPSLSDSEGVSSDQKQEKVLQLPATAVLQSFGEAKLLTDQFITDFHCDGYMETINPKQTQLCVAMTLEAFEQLGCAIRTAPPGQELQRIKHAPQHARLVSYLYEMLECDARLVDIDGGKITRTSVSAVGKPSKDILESLIAAYPDHSFANRLAYYCGSHLADVITAKLDGIKLIFGNAEGRELVSGLYGDSLLNKLFYKQMEDILTRLVSKLPGNVGPLKILEMGGGTGGTTKYLVPLLAKLGIPVEYTFTDLASSFVALARKQYKDYSFMRFRAHDIEKEPADDLAGTQHIIVASNAVHATHSISESTKNIRKALRPDGLLMMLEMTETLRWVDIIFGLLEGWWLFDDERPHALSNQFHWERELHSAGYGHVDWTDGHLPENRVQRIIIAMASGPSHDRLPKRGSPMTEAIVEDTSKREAVIAAYVEEYTRNFRPPSPAAPSNFAQSTALCVLVTGATGSLGSHLVAHLAALPEVASVVCLNRAVRGTSPLARQQKSFQDRRINLRSDHWPKLRVFDTNTAKPDLGLASGEYTELVQSVGCIIHNAWPMSGNRPIAGFEAQFQVIRNLIKLSSDIVASQSRVVTFQFISSIAVVGHYPLSRSGNVLVPEERMGIESVLPNGYGDAKFACERMIDATLRAHPQYFRAMSVRLGQVAGSSTTGYWNAMEHLAFLVKSSQTLRALPNFEGLLSWTPVDHVAATLSDLLMSTEGPPDTIYHIDNPVRQPWQNMIPLLADELHIPHSHIIPFTDWVQRVRRFVGPAEDNPASKLIDFLDSNFERMSCGGLLLDTTRAVTRSPSLASVGPVSNEVSSRYIRYWRDCGFLTT